MRLWELVIASSLLLPSTLRADSQSLAPQIGLRLSSGTLSNQGTSGGSSFTLGALNPNIFVFLTPTFAIGAGYWADLNISAGNLPLAGFDFSSRWFFSGQGTRSKWTDDSVTHEQRDKIAFYLGGDLSQRNYYVTNEYVTKNDTPITGNYAAFNLNLGTEYALTRNLDINAEINYTLFTFASSDPRYRIQAMLFNFGFAYLW